jgi:hypothetical protein
MVRLVCADEIALDHAGCWRRVRDYSQYASYAGIYAGLVQ